MYLTPDNSIRQTQSRDLVEIHLPDGRTFEGPRGLPVGIFLRALPEWDNPPIVGAVINDELRELTYPIDIESRVRPVTMAEADGARIYRRSITFLLEAAFEELFPNDDLIVDHSVASGGFFCWLDGRAPLTTAELARLENRMREIVAADLPLERHTVPLEEAIAYFQSKGYDDKVRLLKYRQRKELVLYRLLHHQDYHHGYMVPSTGFLRWFTLTLLGTGFVLQYPRRNAPTELLPMPEYPKLLNTFRQYEQWLTRLGIASVGALNDSIVAGRAREIILVAEALHEQQISDIAQQIVERVNQARIVLIAGPSSSGKTTFSKRLAVQLLSQGLSPFPLEMDNYFVDRDRTPRDEDGRIDFEALEALDTTRLQSDLQHLLAGEKVQLPHYNFHTGMSEPGEWVQLAPDQLVILEGIHGLNPRLLPDIPSAQTFRIYVSCLTQLNLDRYNRISTTDTRLIRRIVRDARERGYTAKDTIGRWDMVRRGEKRHIFPYQEYADAMFNSAQVVELSVLRPLAEPLLRQVPFGHPEYIEAKRLLSFLQWFQPIEADLIPGNSILQEFLGGSSLKAFKLWEHNNG